jgi:hypothetical protein
MKNELWNQTGGFIKIKLQIISLNSKEGKKGRKEGRLGAFFQIKKKLDLG